MPRVDSSMIRRIDYDEAARELDITFTSGKTYTYFEVPKQVYERFLKASSKGQFFNRHIRGKFAFTREADDLPSDPRPAKATKGRRAERRGGADPHPRRRQPLSAGRTDHLRGRRAGGSQRRVGGLCRHRRLHVRRTVQGRGRDRYRDHPLQGHGTGDD